MDIIDRLEVKVIEAEDLSSADSLFPTPYTEIVVGPDIKKTKPLPESNNPVWNHPTMVFNQILGNGTDSLVAYVKHWDMFTGKDSNIGMVVIPLATCLNAPGIDIDDWYSLQATSEMKMRPSGRIHIIMTYFNAIDEDVIMNVTVPTLQAPNLLQIRVLEGDFTSGILSKSPFESFVVVQVNDLRKESKVSKRSLTPVWDDSIELPVSDGSSMIELTVKKQTQLLRSIFLGRLRIPINEIAAAGDIGINKEYALLNENFEFIEGGNGRIKLQMKWVFDSATEEETKRQKSRTNKKGFLSRIAKTIFRSGTSKDEEEVETTSPLINKDDDDPTSFMNEETLDMTPYELSQYLEEKRRKRKEEIEQLLSKEGEGYDEPIIKEGDYTIQVHIIECADLKGLDISGLSDPQCYIEIFGQKQKTRIIRNSLSGFFDETFYFNFKDLKREQIQDGTLKITVYNYNWFRPSQLIGFFQTDLLSIYNTKDHEYYRHWASLRNPNLKDDIGSQGSVKFSAVVLGPGDNQKFHDPIKDEDDDEIDLEQSQGTLSVDLGDGVSQSLHFLVVSIIKAEGLPGFDRFISSQKNGLYAYFSLEFAGNKPLKSSKVFVTGKKNLSISFEEELRLPVWVPTSCKKAKLSLFNREFGRKDLLVASCYIDFDEVTKFDKDIIVSNGGFFSSFTKKKYNGPSFQYVHFYGANQLVRGSNASANFMNRFPSYGSAYRGNVLLSTRLLKHNESGELAHRSSMSYEIPESLLPKLTNYLLKVMIYQGSDFGSRGQNNAGKKGKYSLGISIGSYEIRSSFRVYENGYVNWVQLCELNQINLPADLRQLPDTILTVYRGSESNHQSIAYARINSVELLPNGLSNVSAVWHKLDHDQSHRSNSTIGYPGEVLIKMSLSHVEDIDTSQDWESERKKIETRKPYCLRLFIYQCRNLPAIDEYGLLDPYIKIRFCGVKRTTKRLSSTLNPAFYECLQFDQLLPEDLTLAPNVLIQVWDQKTLNHSPIGAIRIPVADLPSYKSFLVPPPTPTWREFHGIDGKRNLGEVLVSFQLFEKKSLDQNVVAPESIIPSLRRCYLDLHLVGLRELLKVGRRNIVKPYLQIDVAGQSYGEIIQTGGSRTPSPNNPNFLERQEVMLNLPENPLFTPTMEIKCYDQRFGGSVLIGIATIPLNNKLPWNGEEYIPPRQHLIHEANIKEQKILLKKRKLNNESKKKITTTNTTNWNPNDDIIKDEDDEDENAPLLKSKVVDTGLGIFPLEDSHREPGSKYTELPKIIDQEELDRIANLKKKRKERKQQLKLERKRLSNNDDDDDSDDDDDFDDANLLGDNDGLDNSKSLNQLRNVLGIPSTWANNDFLNGREWWLQMPDKIIQSDGPDDGLANSNKELENYLETFPFENYYIYRGHISFNKFNKRKETVRKIGLLKCIIRVTSKNPSYDVEYNKFFKSIKQVNNCVVRVYIIKASNLQPIKSFFSKSLPDPYIKISLGGQEINDVKKSITKQTIHPDFYCYYEFKTTLPGPSALKISIFNHKKYFGSDNLLGETIIDCEDRYLHPKWTSLGDIKPVENRNLFKIGSQTSQGLVLLWVDIMTAAEAEAIEPIKISGPEKQEYEIRVIVWRSRNVRGRRGGIKDLFVKVFMENDKVHETDTHWRCKNGKASWNWRIKIPITLPLKAKELGRLHIQTFDRNIIISNEILGEATVNLFEWLMLAYHKKSTSIHPFKELREAKKKIAAGYVFQGPDNHTDSKVQEISEELNDEPNINDLGTNSIADNKALGDDNETVDSYQVDGVAYEDDDEPLNVNTPLLNNKSNKGLTQRKNAKSYSEIDKKEKIDESINTADIDDKKNKEKTEEEEEEDEKGEITKLVDQINVFLGIGDTIADDAEWLNLIYHDRRLHKVVNRGQLAISVSIVPESETKARPVGTGRDEPNTNPYLPPPFGRFTFSYNPFSILNQLFGPKVVCLIICCCCCICCFGSFFFLSSYLSGIEAIIQMVMQIKNVSKYNILPTSSPVASPTSSPISPTTSPIASPTELPTGVPVLI